MAGWGLRVAGCKLRVVGYGLRVRGCELRVFNADVLMFTFVQVEGIGGGMKSYRDLDVFQISYELAIAVHRVSLKLPKYEMYEEGSQVRRSSKSITANIVEGYGRRRYKLDFIKFLVYAHASCDETIVHLNFGSATQVMLS